MSNLNDMYFFAKVVEHGGFSAASRQMGVQTSMLSRRVAELEQRLGVRLLNRNTRRVSLTTAGETFYTHCKSLVEVAQAAHDAIDQARSTPRGLVRISCPPALLHSHVGDVIAKYLASHPQVHLQVDASNRRVDVVEERFDLALRVRTPPLEDTDLAVRILGHSDTVLVANPQLWAGRAEPSSLEDLEALPTLAMNQASERHTWQLLDPHKKPVTFSHQPRLAVDDFHTIHTAVLDGVGVAWLPRIVVNADLAAGRLVQVLPRYALPSGVVHAVFPSRRGMVPAVRNLIDALVERFATVDPDTTCAAAPMRVERQRALTPPSHPAPPAHLADE